MKKIKSYLGFATVGLVQDEYSLQNIQRWVESFNIIKNMKIDLREFGAY